MIERSPAIATATSPRPPRTPGLVSTRCRKPLSVSSHSSSVGSSVAGLTPATSSSDERDIPIAAHSAALLTARPGGRAPGMLPYAYLRPAARRHQALATLDRRRAEHR